MVGSYFSLELFLRECLLERSKKFSAQTMGKIEKQNAANFISHGNCPMTNHWQQKTKIQLRSKLVS